MEQLATRVPIIGAGPAGMSCALWLHNLGLRPLLIERQDALGGMARANPYPNEGLLGRPGETGRQNAEAFARHVAAAGIELRCGARPLRVGRNADNRFDVEVSTGDGREQLMSCPAVVMATGTDFAGEEWLEQVPHARRLARAGRVDLGPTRLGETLADRGAMPDEHVVIVGGGDNAFDIGRMLAERGVRVTMLMRSPTPRARPQLIDRLGPFRTAGLVEIVADCAVEALADDSSALLEVHLDNGRRIAADRVLLLLGYRPRSREAWLTTLAPQMDAQGYLLVDRNMETSCRGLFAIGDVGNPAHPSIATAVASGVVAAQEIQRRVAAAR